MSSRSLIISSRVTPDTINQNVKAASYAVRGAIVSRSMEISKILKTPEGQKLYPYKNVIACNIGNKGTDFELTYIRFL